MSGRRKAVHKARTRGRAASAAAGAALPELPPGKVASPGPPIAAQALRWTCPPLKPSRNPPRAVRLLGQERPLRALRTGLCLHAPGYHVLVSGLIGSGRTTLVQHLLRELQPSCRLGPDRVFVHNFDEMHRPRLVTLPRGQAIAFRDQLEEFFRQLHDAVVDALRSRQNKVARRMVTREAEGRERRLLEAVGREAERVGCALVSEPDADGRVVHDVLPVVGGAPVPVETLHQAVADGAVAAAAAERLLQARDEVGERLEEAQERIRRVQRHAEAELRAVDRTAARRVMARHAAEFGREWPQREVATFLRSAVAHIERMLEEWVAVEDDVRRPEGDSDGPEPHPAQDTAAWRARELGAHVVKTSPDDVCPIVVETNPNYQNLFGTIEMRDNLPSLLAGIHPGALVRADGGFLILRVADVLSEPGVWKQLKRALMSGRVELREFDPSAGTTAGTMQPESIPIDLKVVLIGEPGTYEQLAHEDPQFRQIFKVHAEFDTSIPVNAENLRRYADFLQWLSQGENLRAFAPDAAAALAEYGARVAGRQDRLTTQFGELADVARESSFACEQDGAGPVRARHVDSALQARALRHDLVRELAGRDFQEGYLLLRTSGAAVGQINALTTLDTGTLIFGKPCRITAATGAAPRSRAGLLNIEREAELSGPLHDKGILILEGFLLEQFARERPISMQATICLEQMYGGVDGDSASAAELLALLSSMSGVPLLQGLAVTGSLNQKGELQTVGGVNEKIEGFFQLCKSRRLTRKQGVVLPACNVADLMLDREVIEACAAGQFHVWAARDVFEALALLTGRPANEVMARAAATVERWALGAGE